MLRVKLTAFAGPMQERPDWPLARQTPGGAGVWGNCQFFINRPISECDAWVVVGMMRDEECVRCPRANTIFVTYEPPSVWQHSPAFLAQFGTIITCHPEIEHPRVIRRQQGQFWEAGVRRLKPQGESSSPERGMAPGYDFFKTAAPEKSRELSVICSANSATPGHRDRLAFVEKLGSHFGSRLDWFGKGIRPIADKWDALAPYRYHLALENSSFADYWTEKLADAYLAGCYPLYHGCPNLCDYFSEEAFTPIDLREPAKAIDTIEGVLANDLFAKRQAALAEARNMVLDRYNLFAMLAEVIEQLPRDESVEKVCIQDERHFLPRPLPWRLARQARSKLRRAGGWFRSLLSGGI